jgi:hypothetical protein
MALTYTVHWETLAAGVSATITSTSRSYTSGDLVLVLYAHEDNAVAGSLSISNSGTAQTWTNHATTNTANNCKIAAWSCVMSTTQSMTISVVCSAISAASIAVIPHNGQHATPVPGGNVFSGTGGTDVSQAITPTSSGSALWMIAGDWNQTNSYAALANCTIDQTHNVAGKYTSALIRPTTQPRADGAAFTIGETDTSGKIAWIALEVQAAAGGGFTPRSMLMGVG